MEPRNMDLTLMYMIMKLKEGEEERRREIRRQRGEDV